MDTRSEQFEREAEETRWHLSATLEELRGRVTPRRVVDQLLDYTQQSAAGEFLRNLGREVGENPLPLLLIGIGVGWLALASSRNSRAAIVSATGSATDIGAATGVAVTRTGEWGRPSIGAAEREGAVEALHREKESASVVEAAAR
jgi:Protein of unknown function (DUF3618)